ncbi:sugar phosphate isomerase/epimerase [Rhizobium sp. KVB221]|uniref:Sugar phosphate isomerase/epimerase n=1 Tax=Rhizobium setariae TaxID=2801340 RepID=A0A937CQK3_9HYPH|nr:sugar phosphate isomerase/epimerase [Rhizobium setariae]MBL0373132.1 sugar phosphate isomerase/epimerase [Rhizobium setariae]
MTAVSFQLYSARNYPPLSDVLRMLGTLGYREVEGFGGIYGPMDDNAVKQLKADLDANGLRMATGHFGIDQLEDEPTRMLSIARTLGMDSIYCPFLMPDDRPKDAEGWKAFGARLEKASKPFKDAGLEFGWHNHDFEFAVLSDGSLPHDRIFEAGPGLSWEMDVAWVVRGGADPFKFIDLYKDRITSVHVKDIAPAGQNEDEWGWADVGHGIVQWPKIWEALKATKARHFVVEHDNPSDLERCARRSIETIKTF